MNHSNRLKAILKKNAKDYASKNSYKGIERESAFIFNDISNSFYFETIQNIDVNPNYKKRLKKRHSSFPSKSGIKEMQSSNSSDALLMNIFANPNILKWKSIRNLLSISENANIDFGWNPSFANETKHKTEIDMLIENTIFEAKLTEANFTKKEFQIVSSYPKVKEIFDIGVLMENEKVTNYQLIRNILAAEKYDFNFYVLLDERRSDLIQSFYKVKSAIKVKSLSDRCKFVTWQEITSCLGKGLKQFITEKYLDS